MMEKESSLKETEEGLIKSLHSLCPNIRLTVKTLKDILDQIESCEVSTSEMSEMDVADCGEILEKDEEEEFVSIVGPAFNPQKRTAVRNMKNFQSSLSCKCLHVQEVMKLMQRLLTAKAEGNVQECIKNAMQCARMIDHDEGVYPQVHCVESDKVRTTSSLLG